MRVTIETTDSAPKFSTKAVLEHPTDHMGLQEALEMLDRCLKAFGYCYDGELDIVEEARLEIEDDAPAL